MNSTPETIREAQRALARFLEDERQRRRSQDARADAISRPNSPRASFSVEDDAQHRPDSPVQCVAVEYAKARNENLRPLRQVDETDENASEGRDSALAYLERRRRSVIRK